MGWSELGRTSTREQSLPRWRLAGSLLGESEWTERLQDPGEHPPRVVGSMSESPCQAVTISGFFSKSAKFFQTLMAPSSWGDKRGYSNAGLAALGRGGGPSPGGTGGQRLPSPRDRWVSRLVRSLSEAE